MRRIEAVTGLGALDYLAATAEALQKAAAVLKCGDPLRVADRVGALQTELKETQKELAKAKSELTAMSADKVLQHVGESNGVSILTANLGEADANALRSFLDSVKADAAVIVAAGVNNEKGTCAFACAAGKTAVSKGAHAGNVVRAVAQIAGGNGGGKPDSAMAGGKDVTKVDEALAAVLPTVQGMIK